MFGIFKKMLFRMNSISNKCYYDKDGNKKIPLDVDIKNYFTKDEQELIEELKRCDDDIDIER